MSLLLFMGAGASLGGMLGAIAHVFSAGEEDTVEDIAPIAPEDAAAAAAMGARAAQMTQAVIRPASPPPSPNVNADASVNPSAPSPADADPVLSVRAEEEAVHAAMLAAPGSSHFEGEERFENNRPFKCATQTLYRILKQGGDPKISEKLKPHVDAMRDALLVLLDWNAVVSSPQAESSLTLEDTAHIREACKGITNACMALLQALRGDDVGVHTSEETKDVCTRILGETQRMHDMLRMRVDTIITRRLMTSA